MFSHVMLGSNDLPRSKLFYDAILAVIGGGPGVYDPKGRLIYDHRGARLMISAPIDGAPACHANGGTIGFAMASPAEAEAWHKAGLESGGVAIEDPPGVRERAWGDLYLAYLRDPDGNKLCGLYRFPT
jgi:catechol 2,3-dioxygenase-like lactoylglutathione lyase family enzyme